MYFVLILNKLQGETSIKSSNKAESNINSSSSLRMTQKEFQFLNFLLLLYELRSQVTSRFALESLCNLFYVNFNSDTNSYL